MKALDMVFGAAALFGLFLLLNATGVYAESSAVDNVTVTIPVSCSITSMVNTEHTATVDLGTYEDEIGETTFNVFCNDANGFSVYAVGYSDNTYGNTVMMPSIIDPSNGITTGIATSGGTSNWAMKLSAVSGDYAPILETGFNDYHAIPAEYTKVASFASSTDATTGSSFKSTYAAYVSQGQPADTYTGKVKYTVVHPANEMPIGEDRVRIEYDGNGLTFPNGASKNVVEYANVCSPIDGYVSSDFEEYKTSNIGAGGIQNSGYSSEENIDKFISFQDADMLMVEMEYSISADTARIEVYSQVDNDINYYIYSETENLSGTKNFLVKGNEFNLYFYSWSEPQVGNDLGLYIKVYPVYYEQQSGTSFSTVGETCGWQAISGTYAETTTWNDYWYSDADEYRVYFHNENDVLNYLNESTLPLLGTTFNLYANYPYIVSYNGNNASDGSMVGFNNGVTSQAGEIRLIAPNFYKTGYGFAGWSTKSSATVNGNDKVYGPNETIIASDLSYDSNHNAILYAVWVQSSGNLQSFSSSQCSSMSVGDVIALSDSRDNNTYAVGKLADEKCWMLENLRLEHTADITTSNTQSHNGSFGGVFNGLAEPEFSFYGTTPNSLYTTDSSSTSLEIITGSNQMYRIPRYNNDNLQLNSISFSGVTLTPTPFDIRGSNKNTQWYGYGNSYNWPAAVADTGEHTVNGEIVMTSICPSGWRLPTGGPSSDFTGLSTALGGSDTVVQDEAATILSRKFASYPNNYVMSRSYGIGGDYISLWSATNYNNTNAYNMYIQGNGYLDPSGRNSKNNGRIIRCVTD